MFDNSALLTVRELAERLRVSLATAYQLLKQGKIPPIRGPGNAIVPSG